ncbi:MAG: hypothetical protein M3N18_12920 [Actinomycetota bacterium]|nr:hypothetical protein [Actinomycetota bacterium]
MPEEYGDFTIACKRWRLWKERGLWRRIVEVLAHEDLPGLATKGVNRCCKVHLRCYRRDADGVWGWYRKHQGCCKRASPRSRG